MLESSLFFVFVFVFEFVFVLRLIYVAGLDVLVNNAGILLSADFASVSMEEVDQSMQVRGYLEFNLYLCAGILIFVCWKSL